MPKDYQLFLRGEVGRWNFSSDMTRYILDSYPDKEVHVLINSLGGNVDEAITISSLFRIHGNVHCHYVGMNASAATFASMGAKRVTMDAHGLFLVHQCMSLVCEWDYMNADELDAHIKELEKKKEDQATIDACIAGLYASRCKKTKDELLVLMKKGGWLTAQQALDWGFVDELTDDAEDKAERPQMTAAVASYLADAGMPKPPIAPQRGSLFDRFIQFFTQVQPSAPEAKSDEPSKKSITMPKLSSLSACLGTELTFENSAASITETQAAAIDAALAKATADAQTAASDHAEKVAELEAKIAELKKVPAASTDTVINNKTSVEPDDGPGEDIEAAVDLLMKM